MPWFTPTLRQVRTLVRDNVRANLPGSDANVPNSLLRIMSDAMGALCHLALQYIDFLARMIMPDSAEREWLDRHGQIWLVNSDGSTGRKLATLSVGLIAVTGNRGVVLPQNTQFQNADLLGFESTERVVLGAGATNVPVRSLDPGNASNLSIGATVALLAPLAGVDTTARVIQLAGGADEERDDELRARVLFRIQEPPMGGSKSDWEAWVLRVPGCTRAWALPLQIGMGTVQTLFMMDNLRADNHGIPLAEDVMAVQEYLDTVRPVAVKDTFVGAPIPLPLQVSVSQLVNDTPSTRAAIEQSLNNMLYERAVPGGTIWRSWVGEAISDATGEDHHELIYTTTTMPTPNHLPIIGSILYAGG